jgi:hypothetical protein
MPFGASPSNSHRFAHQNERHYRFRSHKCGSFLRHLWCLLHVGRLSFEMKTPLLMLFLFGVMLISSHTTRACSCGMPSVKEAFTKSKVVFSGTVVAIEADGVTFKVTHWWKGSATAEIKVYVRMLGTSCDPSVGVGRTLLVYGYPGGTRLPLLAGYCSRTRRLIGSDDETKELDTLRSSARVRRPTNRWTRAAGACFAS